MTIEIFETAYMSEVICCHVSVFHPSTLLGNDRKMVSSSGQRLCLPFLFMPRLWFRAQQVLNPCPQNHEVLSRFVTEHLLRGKHAVILGDAKGNETQSFHPKSTMKLGAGEWNSKHVDQALKYCEISAVKELDIQHRGKERCNHV